MGEKGREGVGGVGGRGSTISQSGASGVPSSTIVNIADVCQHTVANGVTPFLLFHEKYPSPITMQFKS